MLIVAALLFPSFAGDGFAAAIRGSRPPYAESSLPDYFPDAPGPRPGEGNMGSRLLFAENSALYFSG